MLKYLSLLLLTASAASQAPEDHRPPLFFREDWKEIAPAVPVTSEHLSNPKLQLELSGPGKEGVRKSHHETPKDDPYYIWTGSCPANCAIALRDKDSFADLTGLAKIRWRTKQSGFRYLRLMVKLANGTWLVSDYAVQPIPKPEQDQAEDGVFFEGSTTNWWAPSFDPETELLYVNATHGFSVGYLTPDNDEDPVQDHQGGGSTHLWGESMLLALDYQTGKPRWKRVSGRGGGAVEGRGNGILTTAGQLLFTNESGQLVALDPVDGKVLWHVNAGGELTGSPMTYELDGRQYIITPVDGVVYAWALPAGAR